MINELRQLETLGYVRAVNHQTLPLIVWNYTPVVQFSKLFGDYPLLRSCRGLVTDLEGNIVSHPLLKFHNWEELHPSERPCDGDKIEITLKMDGSLLIVSRYQGQLIFNTRGSFYSDQAIAAEKLFYELYDPTWIDEGATYLFEFVSPENKIVVQYLKSDLIHLARIETATGKDLPRDKRFHCVEVYELNGGVFGEELYALFKSMEDNFVNKEGLVVRQVIDEPRQNFRMKWKTHDYIKLHRIVTGVSNKTVWEMLREGKPFDGILEVCPDEFNEWLKATKAYLELRYLGIESRAKYAYDCVRELPNRKEQATALMSNHKELSAIVFKMLDGQDYSGAIWNMVKPDRFVQPFANKGEE